MSAYRLITFSSLLVLLAACGGSNQAPQAPLAQQGAPAAVPVTVVTLQPQPVTLSRELPGRTNAMRISEVRPQVSGIIRKREFKEGDDVKAGQSLYLLEDETYRADLSSAKAQMERAEAAVEQARLQAKRADELVRVKAISTQDNENAIANLRLAEGDLGVARAAVERSEVLLGYTRITSPINGVIGRSMVTEGALVTANQAQALTTIQQLDPMYVDVTQSSSEMLQLRRALAGSATQNLKHDAPVTIVLEDGTRYPQAGKLTFTDVAVDPSTGSFALRAVVPNPNKVLMPGMYVRAVIENFSLDQALLVPQQGITRDPKGNATAMVVGEDGTAQRRTVQVSRTVGDQWLVSDGLHAGDRVIVAGLQKIKEGAPVQPTEAGAAIPAPATAQ
ncbi:MAG: efflux RND transporter periplasmic adaptor subunit [Chromatiales bacterium]|jgi:membrane fusion protein (multidrug efflux system)|nr:efflux RND transporter periplasmic adaptor subunit [Chromatiales bacterium]